MITCVTDLAWGDTGKGKIVDSIASEYDALVRFNGGPNAGHTVYANGKKMTFHHLPSGMFVDNPPEHIVLSGGMVVNPVDLANEIKKYINTSDDNNENLAKVKNLVLSDRIHCIMPWHIEEDNALSKQSIGTTGKGIGPCYASKMIRTKAIRLGNLLQEIENIDFSEKDKYVEAAKFLNSFVSDERPLLRDLIRLNKNILFESANGIHLDIDHGSYPFVTSSGCGPAYIPQSCGLPNLHIDRIIGITKAYTTRVGNGDLPTEIKEEFIKDSIRVLGKEYGTTTGRSRRIGWLDLDVVKEGVGHTGATEIVITHTDTISKACEMVGIDYFMCKMNNEIIKIPVWKSHENYVYNDNFQNFIRTVEDFIGLSVTMVGTGKDRNDIICLEEEVNKTKKELNKISESFVYDSFYNGLKNLIHSCRERLKEGEKFISSLGYEIPILKYSGMRRMGQTTCIKKLIEDRVFSNVCVFCKDNTHSRFLKDFFINCNLNKNIDVFIFGKPDSYVGKDFRNYDAIIFDNSNVISEQLETEIRHEWFLSKHFYKENAVILLLN